MRQTGAAAAGLINEVAFAVGIEVGATLGELLGVAVGRVGNCVKENLLGG